MVPIITAIFLLGASLLAEETKVRVIGFEHPTCTIAGKTKKFRVDLQKQFAGKVSFQIFLAPLFEEDEKNLEIQANLPMVKKYEVEHVPDYLVLNSKGDVVYRGGMFDPPRRPDGVVEEFLTWFVKQIRSDTPPPNLLEAAIEAAIAGNRPAIEKSTLRGCGVPEWARKPAAVKP